MAAQAAARAAGTAQGNVVDLSQYVSMSMYKELADKVASAEQQKLDDILEAACIDGRIVGEGNRRAYATMAKADPEGFKKTIASLPAVHARSSNSTAAQPTMTAEAMASALSADEIQMARAFQKTNLEYATMKLNHIKETKDAADRGQAN
jgi:phage I-like protein